MLSIGAIVKKCLDSCRHWAMIANVWGSKNLSPKTVLLIIAVVIGIFAGIAAVVLKAAISFATNIFTAYYQKGFVNYWFVLVPLCGLLLTGIYQRYILKHDIEHGEEKLIKKLRDKIYNLKGYLIYSPIIASSITLGAGGSGGSEGPIATVSAAIGSKIARFFNVSQETMCILVGCGAGAGIAAIFKAPIGGAMFTLEVLAMQLTTPSVLALVISTLTATVTVYAFTGCTLDLAFYHIVPFTWVDLGLMLFFGIFCGIYSIYYDIVMKWIGNLLGRISNPWKKNIIAGLALSLLIFLFPPLYGEGYDVMEKIINGDTLKILDGTLFNIGHSDKWELVLFIGGVMMCKCFATAVTNSGGGVSGDFAPVLFAGCIVGTFFSSLLNDVFGQSLVVGMYGIFGMVGVMSGVIRAPLMAMFLVIEMTNSYQYTFPLLIVSMVSYVFVKLYTSDNYFSSRIMRRNGLVSKLYNFINS